VYGDGAGAAGTGDGQRDGGVESGDGGIDGDQDVHEVDRVGCGERQVRDGQPGDAGEPERDLKGGDAFGGEVECGLDRQRMLYLLNGVRAERDRVRTVFFGMGVGTASDRATATDLAAAATGRVTVWPAART
jgi:hypothetical protein